MRKIVIIDKPRCVPVYDDETGKFLYWRMWYNISENVVQFRHFKNTLFSSAYKKMCRFQTRYLEQQKVK